MRYLIVIFLFITYFGFAKMTPEEYIEKYRESAIREMKRSGVPASITLSQGMLESGNGNSELAIKANNHFGIKCHSDWKGPSVKMDDDAKNECFRKYKSVYDSYLDHSCFLKNRSRYAFLFQLKITNYKGWAKGLKKAGYATNPKYPELLIRIIERHQLNQYDKGYKPTKVKEDRPLPKELVVKSGKKHSVMLTPNRVKYIKLKKGDTFYSLQREFDLRESMFRKYNDMTGGKVLQEGQRLFIQPKRGKAKEPSTKSLYGETLWSISQKYAVKLKNIKKYNSSLNNELQEGTIVKLRK